MAYTGNYPSGITLTNSKSTIASSAVVNTASAASGHPAVYGVGGASWTLTNYGTVVTAPGAGIDLADGGYVNNKQGGTIGGIGYTGGLGFGIAIGITEGNVKIPGAVGTVTNSGTIATTGTSETSIFFEEGGTITNNATGVITTTSTTSGAISIDNATGVVTNSGTIKDTNNTAVHVAFGTVTNLSGGLIQAATFAVNIGTPGTSGSTVGTGVVINAGSISATGTGGYGVYLASGGQVTNQSTGTISSGDHGVLIDGAAGTVVNLGSISDTSTANAAINLNAGGTVTNGSTTDTTATVSSARTAITMKTITGGVTNFGTVISTASGTNGGGVYFSGGGTFTNEAGAVVNAARNAFSSKYVAVTINNYGLLENTATPGSGGDGIYVGGGGTVTNEAGGTISSVTTAAVAFKNDPGTLINYGLVKNTPTLGMVYFNAGGTLINGSAANHTATLQSVNDTAVVIKNAGSVAVAVNVTNFGSIIAGASGTGTTGVYTAAGGTITNEVDGLITGYQNAVSTKVTPATVLNYGTLSNTATAHTDVYFGGGGSLINGSTSNTSALIDGGSTAVTFKLDSGTVTNFATISAAGSSGIGIYFGAGGTITNGSTADQTATVQSANNIAVVTKGSVATDISNFGTIRGGGGTAGLGVYVGSGGTLTNAIGALISAYSEAVLAASIADTILNYGTISNTGSAAADVILQAGGRLVNGSSSDRSAEILSPKRNGVAIENVSATMVNYGTIAGGGGHSGINIAVGSVLNSGLISGATGIYIGGNTASTTGIVSVTNSAVITGTVGIQAGIADTSASTILNYGTITGTGGAAVELGGIGSTVINGSTSSTGALISGANVGISFSIDPGTVANFGTIIASGTAIYFNGGGTVTNEAGALISSGVDAVFVTGLATGPAVLVNNAGTIQSLGTNPGLFTVDINIGGTVTNSGLISSQSDKLGGTVAYGAAVLITGGAGSVANTGTINAGGKSNGVVFASVGGNVVNGSTSDTAALISGTWVGVYIGGGPGIAVSNKAGTVDNYGTISGTRVGVELVAGGTVGNSGAIDSSAGNAVYLLGGGNVDNTGYIGATGPTDDTIFESSTSAAAGVVNSGTIKAGGSAASAVVLNGGGTVNNTGLISAAASNSAVLTDIGVGVVINSGTIANSVANAIHLASGTIVNQAGGFLQGGTSGEGAEAGGTLTNQTYVGTGFIANYGSITTLSTLSAAVYLGIGSGTVVNGSTSNTKAVISAVHTGILVKGTAGTVVNFGTVDSTGTGTTGEPVYLDAGGTVTNYGLLEANETGSTNHYPGAVGVSNVAAATVRNFGTITDPNNSSGIDLGAGGTVINGSTSATAATINVAHMGVYIGGVSSVVTPGAVGIVVNYGTIESSNFAGHGVELVAGGTITNHGLISSARTTVSLANTSGTVVNWGSIVSTATGSETAGGGVYLQAGGKIFNQPGASITALRAAVAIGNTFATNAAGYFGNFGTVTGDGVGVKVGVGDTGATTILNDGTITGTNGTAVGLYGGADTLILEDDSVLNGAVKGFAAGDTIDFAGVQANAKIFSNGTLTLENGSTPVATLALQGTFTTANFTLGSDGSSGTDVTFNAVQSTNTISGTVSHGITLSASGTYLSPLTITPTGAVLDTGAGDAVNGPAGAAWTVSNAGTVSAANGRGVYLGGGGVVTNAAGGRIAGTYGVYLAGTAAATVANSGIITGAIGIEIAGADTAANTIVNSGTITGTGGTAIQLAGNSATLVIEQNSVLTGAVAGFASGDTIDFAGQSGTSVSFSYGVLSLMAGGAPIASVDLSGLYAAGEFAVASDGSGGTDVTFSADPTQAQLTTTSDFAGDGMSDVLWQNDNAQDSGTGQTAIWLMDGVNPTAEDIITTVPTSWHVVATGDFYGTGDAAILWQNDDGQAGLWEMNGTNPTAETVFASPPPSWHMIATGDFNGDGYSDVLWQYEDTGNASDSQNGNVAIWEMNGASAIAAAVVAQPGPDWDVIGTGDFNGDGKSDILWQYEDTANSSDPQNGNVAIWEMNGLTPIAEAVIAQPGPDWHVVGTGDFNGDGKADILWQYEDTANSSDPQNGNVAIWLMNGTTPTAEAVVATPGSAWQVIGTGDYDGSGRSDILWQNTNGQAAIWLMNGLTPTTESVFAAPPSSWHVIPA